VADDDAVILGPLLRRVDGDRATIWIEVRNPGTVEIRAGDLRAVAPTFTVHGHHIGFVCLDGLPPAAFTPYEVYLDDRKVWPPANYGYPPPMIRTRPGDAPVRILFGSCRESSPLHVTHYPPDALDAYATRLAATVNLDGPDAADWPDLLMLLGDQVYADNTSDRMRKFLHERRAVRRRDAPPTQVVDFHEYTQLYVDSWTDPDIRWLLSTVSNVMIFDDHEVIDDWNISAAWRADIAREPWWADRIRSGLSSYWVYQHLGNIAPAELDTDAVYHEVRGGGDVTTALDEFGAHADLEREAYRWSYAFDIGRTRVVVLDNRAGRQLEPGHRTMLAPNHWTWFEKQVDGDFDHLVIGASLPWLMPPAIHHVEMANERMCESSRRTVARTGEKLRRAVDLEHWAAFRLSFTALTDLLSQVADRPDAPATTCVVSGDVHHSYVALAGLPTRSPVYQLTCSPVHNALPLLIKKAMRFSWSRAAERMGRGIARIAGVPPVQTQWRRLAGPVYENAVSELVHNGRSAEVRIEATAPDKKLRRAAEVTLA
jgi:hypothetical protein